MDTIFAIASGAGTAAITVFRLSGPASGDLLDALCPPRPTPRRACLRALRDGHGELLDRALVLWFPAPGSYTGEDSAELHLHGGHAVASGVATALITLGARPAEPGEFTRRAFVNGRMDLLEAEAIADLIAAETAAQRNQALLQMDGALGALYRGWTARLTRALAQQEALIDFPDEDLPSAVEAAAIAEILALHGEIMVHLDDGHRGERLRRGLLVAIVGPPNVGKSTLINALAEREVAIVAATPGTTRDVLEARIDLAGIPVTLADTAGLRLATDPIEAEGVRRAYDRIASADVVILVTDATTPQPPPNISAECLLRVTNKSDLVAGDVADGISARTGAGLREFRDRLAAIATQLTRNTGSPPLTRERHRAALHEAAEYLGRAAEADLPEFRGEDLRLALRSIGRVTGHVGAEDILDSLFRQFCIGK